MVQNGYTTIKISAATCKIIDFLRDEIYKKAGIKLSRAQIVAAAIKNLQNSDFLQLLVYLGGEQNESAKATAP